MDHTLITERQWVENYHFPAADHLADPAKGLLYCAIPKCGCSTGKRWFLSVAEPELLASEPGTDFHYRCRARWALCLTEDLGSRDLLTRRSLAFAFVRDPFERIASAFTEKFTLVPREELFLPAGELAGRIEAARGDNRTGISFAEFVEHLAEAPDDALDAHWRPQTSFLRLRNDYLIAPLERLSETLRLIASALGRAAEAAPINRTPYSPEQISGDPPELLSLRSSTDLYAANIHPRARELYTHRLRDLVRDRFAADLDLHRRALASWSETTVARAIRRYLPRRGPSAPFAAIATI